MSIQDILAAIAVVINGLPQGLLALTFGFAAFPTALAFLVGPAGMLLTGQIAPISFQAEAIVLAGELGENRNERLSIVFYTGIVMAIIGGFGLLQPTTDFIGIAVLNGMMAGVGIILAKVGMNMFKANKVVSAISIASAFLVYFITKNLVYTIVVCVFLSSAVNAILSRKNKENNTIEVDMKNEKLIPLKPVFSGKIVRNTLALVTMQIGGNIAYANITGSLAKQSVNVDHVTLYSGIADSVSAFFGGSPVEAIISGTAVAPNPKISGIIMMLIFAVILLVKVLPKIAKHVPSESIAGFLIILGAIVVFPDNIALGIAENPVIAGTTAVVTAGTDPFIGMIAGVIVKFLIGIF